MYHYQELLEMVTKQRHKRVSAGIGVKNYGILVPVIYWILHKKSLLQKGTPMQI